MNYLRTAIHGILKSKRVTTEANIGDGWREYQVIPDKCREEIVTEILLLVNNAVIKRDEEIRKRKPVDVISELVGSSMPRFMELMEKSLRLKQEEEDVLDSEERMKRREVNNLRELKENYD